MTTLRRRSTRRYIGWAIVVVVPSLLLRLWAVDALGVNSDEAVYAGQAASLARDPASLPFFPVFRAHPLLFQSLLSLQYRPRRHHVGGRLLAVAFGMGTVWLTYAIGARLYGRRVGAGRPADRASCPTRDGQPADPAGRPDGVLRGAALYLLAGTSQTERATWLYAAASRSDWPRSPRRRRSCCAGGDLRVLRAHAEDPAAAPPGRAGRRPPRADRAAYPISLKLAGHRRPAAPSWRGSCCGAPTTPGGSTRGGAAGAGLGVVAVAVVGLVLMRRGALLAETCCSPGSPCRASSSRCGRSRASSTCCPSPPRGGARRDGRRERAAAAVRWRVRALAVTTAGCAPQWPSLVASLAVTSWNRVQPDVTGLQFLAGTGGVPGRPGGREWVDDTCRSGRGAARARPVDGQHHRVLRHHQVVGLSVSPNPLHRNPVVRAGPQSRSADPDSDLQYLVWDSFSASRSPFFARQLLATPSGTTAASCTRSS